MKLLAMSGVSVTVCGAGAISGCSDGGSEDDVEEIFTALTRCAICGNDCCMEVTIDNGEVISVQPWKDPSSTGALCERGLAYGEVVNASQRILSPMKKVGAEWQAITWDEALDEIADKFASYKSNFGPQSVVMHYGMSQVMQRLTGWYGLYKRFANTFGTINFGGVGSQCTIAGAIAQIYSAGQTRPDIENASCIVMWGCNPSESNPLEWLEKVLPALDAGAKLIVIDPRITPMSQAADIHLQPTPGTDGAIGLAFAKVIIDNNLEDTSIVGDPGYVDQDGYAAFLDLLESYTPEDVELISGVEAGDIEAAALMYATSGPACLKTGGNGVEHHTNGFQTMRAINLLSPLTGNFDIEGGDLVAGPKALPGDIMLASQQPSSPVAIGATEHPVFFGASRQAMLNRLPSVIDTGNPYDVKAMLVVGGNPAITHPNSSHYRSVLGKLDYLVVMDFFMTETAESADLFLPAATFLEKDLLTAKDQIFLTPKVMEPLGEAWSEFDFLNALAKKMGYTEEFPFETIDDAIDLFVEPLGTSAAALREDFLGIPYESTQPITYQKYKTQGFVTNSTKVEFASPNLGAAGQNPLPDYVPPDEYPGDFNYPLIITTGYRIPAFYNTRFRNAPSLLALYPNPLLEINVRDSGDLNIKEGDGVTISTPRGSADAVATIVDGLPPGVVATSHGWDSANINELTKDTILDPISGFPAFRSFRCKVEKA